MIPKSLWQWSLSVVLIGLMAFGLQISKYCAYDLIQKHLQTQIHGRFEPGLDLFEFKIKHARFEIRNKVQVEDADLEIRYQFVSIFPPRLRLQVLSRSALIYLQERWFREYPVEKARIDQFYVDFLLDSEGIRTVYEMIAKSPAFKFEIKPR